MKDALSTIVMLLTASVQLAGTPESAGSSRVLGRVLLLDNEHVLEGMIEIRDDRYCLRQGEGETLIPAHRVLTVTQTREEAYAFLRDRANLRDSDERMHLARWCLRNGLIPQARVEVEAVLKMRPQDAAAAIFLRGLDQLPEAPQTAPEVNAPPRPKPVIEPAALEFNRQSLELFVRNVQPTMMNACIRCHGPQSERKLQLTHVAAPGDRKAMFHNLAAALAFVNREKPQESLLLKMATTAHGPLVVAPLRDLHRPAIDALDEWIRLAVAPDGSETPVAPRATPMTERVWEPRVQPMGTPAKSTDNVFGANSTSTPPKPVKTAPSDPFDPAIFNGEIRPMDEIRPIEDRRIPAKKNNVPRKDGLKKEMLPRKENK